MSRHRKDPLRPLTPDERIALTRLRRSPSAPAAQVERARALLAIADGASYRHHLGGSRPSSRFVWPFCKRHSAMSIGQAENLPPLAFSVRFRRYPPGLLIMALRCTIAASATHASSAPITLTASAQALGLMPKAPRTVSATPTKSRQLEMARRANIPKSGQAWRTMLNGNGLWGARFVSGPSASLRPLLSRKPGSDSKIVSGFEF